MPTALDNKLVPKTLAIINKVGRNMDFTLPLASSYDPVTGTGAESINTTYTVKASPPIDFAQRYIDGDSVRRGDVRIILAAKGLPFIPIPDMKIDFDGHSFSTIAVLPIYSGELVAAWDLQARK